MNRTQEFIDRAFSVPANQGVKCPRNRHRNTLCEDKRTLTLHLGKFGFMPSYGRITASQSIRELH
jgi:hypothetical protein